MPADRSDQEEISNELLGALRPELFVLIKDKIKAIKEATDESFNQSRRKARRETYRQGQTDKGKTVKTRKVHVPLAGEDPDDMQARLKSERNAADYEARLARDGKKRKNISRAAMTPDQVKAWEAQLKREKRAAAKAISPLAQMRVPT